MSCPVAAQSPGPEFQSKWKHDTKRPGIEVAVEQARDIDIAHATRRPHIARALSPLPPWLQVKKMGQKQAVEDIMYFSILDQFRRLGVNPIQPGQLQYFSDFGPVNWESLTRGVHSDEALEVVRSHMRAVLGPVVDMPLTAMNAAIKISKFHAVQMFAASVLFGYFLRRADKRFALAKSLGMAPRVMSDAETVEMLEDLFNRADADEDSGAPSGPLCRLLCCTATVKNRFPFFCSLRQWALSRQVLANRQQLSSLFGLITNEPAIHRQLSLVTYQTAMISFPH